ncbi:MAG: hypothetical protein WDO15_05920 [Bacteroidota bacterium]
MQLKKTTSFTPSRRQRRLLLPINNSISSQLGKRYIGSTGRHFFNEARRVLKPGGVIAIWGYSLLSIDKEIDPIVNHFYTETIGPYWDKERKLVDEQYKTIEFPFRKIEVPDFEFSFEWTADEFIGYISTWSSVQKYIKQNNQTQCS